MGDIVPLKGKPRRPPRAEGPAEADTWVILEVTPARRGWYAYVLAYDDVTGPELAPVWWRTPIAAWGRVEWTWGGVMLPGFAKVEQFWEALVCSVESGVLSPAMHEERAINIVTVEVLGPKEEPPRWYGGTAETRQVAAELVDRHLERHPRK